MSRALWLLLGGVTVAAFAPSCSSKNEPQPAPQLATREQMLDPQTCKQCHQDHYRDWSGSMHAYASDDPVFRAMNKRGQRETGGALGDFCVKCHAPMAVRTGATKDGLNLDGVAQNLKGVTCYFCHSVDSVAGAHDNPLHLADDLVMRGPFYDPVANTVHAAAGSPLHDRDQASSATLCGPCHDIVTGHGAAIERTFTEWQGSVFAKTLGATCGQCHMEQSASLQPVAQAPGVFSRRFHGHTFAAVDTALTDFPERDDQTKRVKALLGSTLQTAICVGDDLRLSIVADNVAAGHDFPSGSTQDRRLWFEVRAFKGGAPIYESGTVADATSPVTSTDPDLWLIRDCMFDDKGSEVSMFWQAASYESNQFPAQLTFDVSDPRYYQSHVTRNFPRTGALSAYPDRVTMRVRLQPIGLDVLDDLVKSGDLDSKYRDAMPTLDVGGPLLEWTPATAKSVYYDSSIPVRCVTTTNLNVQANKVPAATHMKCKP